MSDFKRCEVKYQGKTYPHLHGRQCALPEGHFGQVRSHWGEGDSGRAFHWWQAGETLPDGRVKT